MKHYRTRESSELGATRYHAACGATGLRNLEFAKDTSKVDCPACIRRIRGGRKARQQKGKQAPTCPNCGLTVVSNYQEFDVINGFLYHRWCLRPSVKKGKMKWKRLTS